MSQLIYSQDAGKGWWTFTFPGKNDKPMLLDLRYLNEKVAGQNGFIGLSKDGESFVDGRGKAIRFWASNGGDMANEVSDSALAAEAKFLAQRGVNLVRFHGSINPEGKEKNLFAVDTAEVNNIWRCVAAMKSEGIYTVISPFWPHNGHMGGVSKEWGIEGYGEKDDMWAVLFFNDRLQSAYRQWIKYLYTTPNPHTNTALKDDPAVAIIQIENEDAVFFWTMQGIKPALRKMIGTQFAGWLRKKYGSLELVRKAWGAARHKDDDFNNSIVGLIGMYEMTIPENDTTAIRLRDQVAFYAETQRNFYDGIYKYIREELGCRQLVNANNWRTASQSRLLDLERWTNAGVEVMAVNKYFDPGHNGPNNGWRIDPGDQYTSPSAWKNPQDISTNIRQVAGHPMMVTEGGWNLPNKYQTEGPLLVAAYGGLTGLDAFFWFHPGSVGFDMNPYFTFLNLGGQHPLKRWTNATPGEAGMYPANALIQRLGYVKESEPILHEDRTMQQLLRRDIPLVYEEQSFDPNRDFIFNNKNSITDQTLPALLFLTGKVEVNLDSQSDSARLNPRWRSMVDERKKQVRSVTGQHLLDYGKGIFELNAPKAKAVSGFLAAKEKFQLGDVEISSINEYATIEVVSMDEQVISESAKILVQVGTVFRPTGWKEEKGTFTHAGRKVEGFTILQTGKMPWLGMAAAGTIRIRNARISRAMQLDADGRLLREWKLTRDKTMVSLQLLPDAYYILLQ